MNDRRKHIVVLSGAGISAESGLGTFRDEDGLWKGVDPMTVASAEAWKKDSRGVLDFYNQRRDTLAAAVPNAAHYLVAELERWYDVTVLTQNIDDLHERAGSSNVIHLHGELTKARPEDAYDWDDGFSEFDVEYIGYEPIFPGKTGGENRSQMRPHVVLFGEPAPLIAKAALEVRTADIFLIVGTSLQVEPASLLYDELRSDCPVYVIDPGVVPVADDLGVFRIREKATDGMQTLFRKLGHDVTMIEVKDFNREGDQWVPPRSIYHGVTYILSDDGCCLSRHSDGFWEQFHYDDQGRFLHRVLYTYMLGCSTVRETDIEYGDDGRCIREGETNSENERETSWNWSRKGMKAEIRDTSRTRVYYRPDGLPKHVIVGWTLAESFEFFYKWYPDGTLRSVKAKLRVYERPRSRKRKLHILTQLYDRTGLLRSWQSDKRSLHFQYVFDDRGNWVSREKYDRRGNPLERIERTIRYGGRAVGWKMDPVGLNFQRGFIDPNRDTLNYIHLNDRSR